MSKSPEMSYQRFVPRAIAATIPAYVNCLAGRWGSTPGWDDRGIDGILRFLNRFWKLAADSCEGRCCRDEGDEPELRTSQAGVRHYALSLEGFSLNAR